MFIFFFWLVGFFADCALAVFSPPATVSAVYHIEPQTVSTIKLVAVGDLMCHSQQFNAARQADGTYNFLPFYAPVQEYLQSADLTVGNLETVLGGTTKNFTGYPAFNSPNEYADALVDCGFDVLFTANNHSYDQGKVGVERTIAQLNMRQIPYVGTFELPEEKSQKLVIREVSNIKIAFLGYTQFSNIPLPEAKQYLVNHIDTLQIKNDIARARSAGAEIVVVNYHWGDEYRREPNPYQRLITQKTIALGADIILGEHPHVLQPIENFKATHAQAGLDSGVVIYSMGNFISGQRKRYTDTGVMFGVVLEKNLTSNKIRIKYLEYVPTWVFQGIADGKSQFIIFPAPCVDKDKFPITFGNLVPEETRFLNAEHWLKMKQANDDSRFTLHQYGAKLRLATWKKPPPLFKEIVRLKTK